MTNSVAYDAALRQRGSLTVWLTEEAFAAWSGGAADHAGRVAALVRPCDRYGN